MKRYEIYVKHHSLGYFSHGTVSLDDGRIENIGLIGHRGPFGDRYFIDEVRHWPIGWYLTEKGIKFNRLRGNPEIIIYNDSDEVFVVDGVEIKPGDSYQFRGFKDKGWKDKPMYMITLFDQNSASCTSGVFRCFVDDIRDFKKEWFKLNKNENQKENFIRSLNGEMVSDYYVETPELNIVQQPSDYVLYEERDLHFKKLDITLHNAYDWPSDYYIEDMSVHVRWCFINKRYTKLATFRITGMAKYEDFKPELGYYRSVTCWGNPILNNKQHNTKLLSDDFTEYANDTIDSIAYLPIDYFESEDELMKDACSDELSEEQLERLLQDIPGEAG